MNTTDEGFSFAFHKNYKPGPTYPRLAIFSLQELNQTSLLICFEGWNTFLEPIESPWEPNLSHTKRVSAWPVINQLCFPECHFSAYGIFLRLSKVQMKFYKRSLQSSPFLCLSRLCRSFAHSQETRFAHPNRRGELARRLYSLKYLPYFKN